MNKNEISGRHAVAFMNQFDYIREAGTDADRRAQEAILASVRALGADPVTESFTFPVNVVDKAVFTVTAPFEKNFPMGGYMRCGSTIEGGITAPFVYAENGDDISLADVKGKIVLVNDPVRDAMYDKLVTAGALAFLTVTGTPIDEGEDLIPADRNLFYQGETPIQGGVLHHKDVITMVEAGACEAHFELQTHTEERSSNNIICRVEGSDPELKKEVLTVTAHYDSVPAGPGAYDNMSGCGIVYELLTYFLKNQPKRSMEFIFFGAEEKGLVGSRAYTSQHEAEMPCHRFNMNIDLAGQLVGGTVFGVTAEHCVDDFLLATAKEIGIGAGLKNQLWSSDSNCFAAKGVPAMTLNRDGYGMHTRHDTLDKISWWSMERSSQLLCAIADKCANAEVFPFERKVPQEYLDALNRH